MTDVYYRTTQGAFVKVEGATFAGIEENRFGIFDGNDDVVAILDAKAIEWITTMPQVAAGFGWVERIDGVKPRDNDSPASREGFKGLVDFYAEISRMPWRAGPPLGYDFSEFPNAVPKCSCAVCTAERKLHEARVNGVMGEAFDKIIAEMPDEVLTAHGIKTKRRYWAAHPISKPPAPPKPEPAPGSDQMDG